MIRDCLYVCGFVFHLFLLAQINNFFNLLLFPTVIHQRSGKRLISETVKDKLYISWNMQFIFSYPKDIQKLFLKSIYFVKNLEMMQVVRRGYVLCIIIMQCLWKSICVSSLRNCHFQNFDLYFDQKIISISFIKRHLEVHVKLTFVIQTVGHAQGYHQEHYYI